MNREKYVVLEITNWTGISLGAEHYYGKLFGYVNNEYTMHEIEKKMSAKDAKIFREKDDWKFYKKGSKTSRFDDPDDIRKIALSEWRNIFINSFSLVEGHSSSAEPMKVLWVKNTEYLNELNEIKSNFDNIERLYKNYKKMDNLGDAFFRLLERASI